MGKKRDSMAGETETANTEKEQRELRVEQRENLNIGNGDSLSIYCFAGSYKGPMKYWDMECW